MVRLVALVRRRVDLSPEASVPYWTGTHAPLAAAIPGMRGHRINVAGDPGSMAPAPYDGSAKIWLDSREATESGLASLEGVAAGEDTANSAASITFLVTGKHMILP